ncbi:MAG: family N-acetyltransferase [Brevibacillus sp.]|nr:family N-acetyltransferase [Brevibacillus sp.]
MGYEVLGKNKLSAEELAEIKELVTLCNEHDGIDLKVNPEMLEKRSGEHTEDFLYYEDDQLIGFLGLYVFHGGEAEASAMVHPKYRQKGIFRALQTRAAEECRKRGIPHQLFIVQRESLSGKACMEQIEATYDFSEYWMDFDPTKTTAAPADIQMRVAGEDDIETLIWLNVHGFQMEEERAREMSKKMDQESSSTTYLLLVDEQPIGKLSTNIIEGKGFIFGFCVHPDHQGKGYGRRALAKAIHLIRESGYEEMSLEVASENSSALGLYESCGFVVKSANDYYKLPL